MKYSRYELINASFAGENPDYLFFWGHKVYSDGIHETCLSQWYPCVFTVDGIEYHTAEQYMMAQKALLFGDREVFDEIMAANDPKTYKALGRKVCPFDAQVWNENKCDIVLKGNLAKFSQNDELWAFLLSTGDRVLVEASPYDGIWGIRMGASNPDAKAPVNWKGENLLGFILMEVRDILATGIDDYLVRTKAEEEARERELEEQERLEREAAEKRAAMLEKLRNELAALPVIDLTGETVDTKGLGPVVITKHEGDNVWFTADGRDKKFRLSVALRNGYIIPRDENVTAVFMKKYTLEEEILQL